MRGYAAFAAFYDRLMKEIDYAALADYLLRLFELYSPEKKPETLLDLACGSGSLTIELAVRGIDMIGVDGSADMLMKATEKADKEGMPLMLLCQDMRKLDLYGTVNGAVCVLDSLNHLCRTSELFEVFKRLFLFIEPGGLLIFDVNTIYKHRYVLGNNSFVFEEKDFLCIWRNRLIGSTAEVDIQLDFFVEQDGCYTRLTDNLRERAYAARTLNHLLSDAGFEVLAVYDDMSIKPVKRDSERMVYVARRR